MEHTLINILSYKRGHGSESLDEYVRELKAVYDFEVLYDPASAPLALVHTVGTSETMFSCHLDTVHRTSGKQIVAYDVETELMYKSVAHGDMECLGADDGAGIYLMLRMMEAQVPGVYVFHYGEEKGGIGSSGIAKYHVDFLKTFKRAIAFDRRGTKSIITHQGFSRCCSDSFADELAIQMCLHDLDMAPDDGGIFTDTANYVDYIPECTNLSIGYDHEHTSGEILDVMYLNKLIDAVIKVPWETLPTVRDVNDHEFKQSYWGGFGAANYSNYSGYEDYNSLSRYPTLKGAEKEYVSDADDLMGLSYHNLLKWVEKNRFDPDRIAEVLYDLIDRVEVAEQAVSDYELNDEYRKYR